MTSKPEKVLLVEVGDIFDQLNATIIAHGEVPLIDPRDPQHKLGMDAFMMDLFHDIGYLPEGPIDIAKNAHDTLQMCGQYFDVIKLTPLQTQCWIAAMQALVHRFMEYRLYGATRELDAFVHAYDYKELHGDILVLLPAEDI